MLNYAKSASGISNTMKNNKENCVLDRNLSIAVTCNTIKTENLIKYETYIIIHYLSLLKLRKFTIIYCKHFIWANTVSNLFLDCMLFISMKSRSWTMV